MTTREAWRTWLPYGTLLISVGLVLSVDPDFITKPPVWVILSAAGGAAAWIAFWVTFHPQWGDRRGIMLIFLIGMIGFYAGLVWLHPLFGFFSWTGYLFIGLALDGFWRLLAVVPVAAIAALSQIGGVPTLSAEGGYIFWGFAIAINMLIAGVMFYVEIKTEKNSIKRAQMIVDLAEANRKLEAALRENAGLHAQLLVQAREAGVLDERQRMAGEIHDVLAQGLTGIVTQLEAADAAAARPADHRRHLETAKRLARESLAEARRSVQALRPQQLVGTALPDALTEVVETWSERSGVKAELVTTGTPQRLLPEIETTLLRTAQEGLANVARHAAARRVGLTLSYMEDVVTLDVRDDGAGFDLAEPRRTGSFGLEAMRERLTRIAGSLTVESEPGGGTALSACVPAIAVGVSA
ncbi:sensor histidine kinase [Actinoplanes sp. OR16]|uniref:sensor histidine kinase n=1 Tax=Actinoplanes sp. OR16 TaxID=946334 RepID=UPI001E5C70E2|nr:sensor histidine kinase [Actinoplanes sp. OR16]